MRVHRPIRYREAVYSENLVSRRARRHSGQVILQMQDSIARDPDRLSPQRRNLANRDMMHGFIHCINDAMVRSRDFA